MWAVFYYVKRLLQNFETPFDKLRANGSHIEISVFPFVVSLSNHKRGFCKKLY